jgi:predicted deacylase
MEDCRESRHGGSRESRRLRGCLEDADADADADSFLTEELRRGSLAGSRNQLARRHAMRVSGAVLLSVLALGRAAAGEGFAVGTATAERGQKATGFIEVPAGSDAGTSIPVVVVHGKQGGPVLAVVAGAHGTEYASIVAVEKLIGRLDPEQVSGTVILVPLVNRASFDQKVPHVNPVDGKSMNRFYPGRPDGSQTERASWRITKDVVERCDHLIDLHGGDLDESLRPYSYWSPTGNPDQDAVSREMVLAFGLDHIVVSRDRPKDPAASRYLESTAATRGKPSMTAEAGHAGTVEAEDVDALVEGCLGVLRYLKMLPGTAPRVENPVWIESLLSVTSEEPGLFYPRVKRGSYVEKGMLMGVVTDFFGRTVHEARAPGAGVVLYVCSVPTMTKGGTIASIGVVGRE